MNLAVPQVTDLPDVPTIAEAASRIAARDMSPVELLDICLARSQALDPVLNAWIVLDEEGARAEALALQDETPRGPLHGIPLGLKDIYDQKGLRTTAHSHRFADAAPATQDAATAAHLRAAGAILSGKLATHEFALGGPSWDLPFPPARNPWDPDRFTGGSSSGTGAAVAAGMVLGATGSDTGGSIRVPSAFCGLVGLKPTYDLLDRSGIFPLSWTLDHAGPMAWTTEDCALMLEGMGAPGDMRAAFGRSLKGLTVGVVSHWHETDNPVSEAVLAGIEETLAVLRAAGAEVREITLAPLQTWADCGHAIMLSEAWAIHGAAIAATPELYGQACRERMAMGALLTSSDVIQAQRLRRHLCAEMANAFAKVDLLVTAAAPFPAPKLAEVTAFASYERPALSMPFNVTGVPALALPCGITADGLPVGLQLAAAPGRDAFLLGVGKVVEDAVSRRDRRPDLSKLGSKG